MKIELRGYGERGSNEILVDGERIGYIIVINDDEIVVKVCPGESDVANASWEITETGAYKHESQIIIMEKVRKK
jgi:hypothetical protein